MRFPENWTIRVCGNGGVNLKTRHSLGERSFDVLNIVLMCVLMIITLYPMLHVLFGSFSEGKELMKHEGLLFHVLGKPTLSGYRLILKKLLPENSSAFNLYFVLVQATLFSNNGITVKELKQHFEISENTMRKMLRDIPKNLLVIDKNDREYHYLMNLSELDSFFHSTEFHKMDSSRNGWFRG